MDVIIIAGIAQNGVIGKNGALPWSYPEDLQHFRRATSGFPVIMGRKTFESIGKPLPNRLNIVVSTTLPESEHYVTARTLQEAILAAEETGAAKCFIIGGAEIYRQALEQQLVTEMMLTEIKSEHEGETLFPSFDKKEWKEVSRDVHDEFDFVTYRRFT